VINAGSGSGIVRLAPENSPALWTERFKNNLFRLNNSSRNPGNCGREHCARRWILERHKLIRETRHGTSDADPTNVWTSSNAVHPTTLGNVAVHHWSPTFEARVRAQIRALLEDLRSVTVVEDPFGNLIVLYQGAMRRPVLPSPPTWTIQSGGCDRTRNS
jgi:hypothetical protein